MQVRDVNNLLMDALEPRAAKTAPWVPLLLVTLAGLLACCDSDPAPTAAPDDSPPEKVEDLVVGGRTDSSLTLFWTAPGRGNRRVDAYDIRYGDGISDMTWEEAIPARHPRTAREPGGGELITVTGLRPLQAYEFALKSSYDGSQWSPLSNIARGSTTGDPNAGWWSGFGRHLSPDGPVSALTVYAGDLVAGGFFSHAGGTAANRVARWDGAQWSPFGSGVNAMVWALTVYRGDLIAGGEFRLTGTQPVSFVARWDGAAWQPLGTGVNSVVRALCVYGDELIAGGMFTQAGGVEARYVARWDGTSWKPLGSALAGSGQQAGCYTLSVYENQVIVGGNLALLGEPSARGIAAWDGTSWQPLGAGLHRRGTTPATVFALTQYNGRLIAGGSFTHSGPVEVNGIASWDGAAWQAVGAGLTAASPGQVQAMAELQGNLIVGGNFEQVAGFTANHIARWNETTWQPVGSGMINAGYIDTVRAMMEYNGSLYVGGAFRQAGDKLSWYIARWDDN